MLETETMTPPSSQAELRRGALAPPPSTPTHRSSRCGGDGVMRRGPRDGRSLIDFYGGHAVALLGYRASAAGGGAGGRRPRNCSSRAIRCRSPCAPGRPSGWCASGRPA